jgi:hypothetical protein
MDALGDLVARDRRSADGALSAPRERRAYDYRRFCTTAWKTGNFWRRRGLHADATVAVADDPEPEAVFAFLGAALLGARTRFGAPGDVDARIAVAPRGTVDGYDLPPGGQRVAYGGPPDDPSVAHFERDVWSENPAFPETPVDPESIALVAAGDGSDREYAHADLLPAARAVADDWSLAPGDEVAVRAPLADPGTIVAGVVAPLIAGAAILLPDDEAVGDYAVVSGSDDASESRTVAASTVI